MNKKIIFCIIAIILIMIGWIFIDIYRNLDSGILPPEEKKNLENSMANEEENENNKEGSNSKILVAFFSRADENYSVGTVDVGNTEIMAKNIADIMDADFFKIEPVNAYPANYKECTEVAKKEQSENARPKIKNKVSNFDDYDIIFIGYPNWWGDMPMIVYTFLESYDFSGKTVIPFNTHEGSGSSGTYKTIKNKLSSSKVITNGLAIKGTDAREESSKTTIEKWLEGLDL